MRIIGIDPGLQRTGWGVIEAEGSRVRHIGNGVLLSGSGALALRLTKLFEELTDVVARFAPNGAAVEATFVNKDAAGTLKLGQARGIALLVPARAGLEVGEYAPNAVKKAVVGVGHADKRQVDHMIRLQFPGIKLANADATDALAIALCHLRHAQASNKLSAAIAKARA
ncbi:MAG: crossover junction endodeoxyribonuclease RuvC [Pseudomonadota bacterium]